jgi:hypothetical protein
MPETTGAPDEQRDGISRRALIRRAAATGAVAWAAPTILHMSAAGAQTQSCYAFKLEGGCVCPGGGGLNPGPPPNDPACAGTPGFNTALAAAIAANSAQLACPPAGTIVSAVGCNASATATITLRQGCTFAFTGGKAGPDCFVSGNGVGTNTTTITAPGQQGLSHVVLVVCCGS